MELQRFVGKDTKSVLDEIRATLGEQALIVSNTKVGSKTEIIAARGAQSAAAETQASVREDALEPARQKGDFSQAMANQQRFSSPTFTEDDPWEHIKKINNEISSIKSALKESSEKIQAIFMRHLNELRTGKLKIILSFLRALRRVATPFWERENQGNRSSSKS